jgi:hypothetical protein
VARSDADCWASDALVGRRGTCVVESDLAAAARSCASQAQIGGARLPEVAGYRSCDLVAVATRQGSMEWPDRTPTAGLLTRW